MSQIIQIRRGTASQWTSADPTLSIGEFGYETDTGLLKIGDGSTSWASLQYTIAAASITNVLNRVPLRDSSDGGFQMGTLTANAIDVNQGTLTNFRPTTNTQSGTTYTLVSADMGKLIWFTSNSAITLTIPSGLPTGFNCMFMQTGSGQVTWSASGTTLIQRNGFTKTAGNGSIITVLPHPTANNYVLSGDGA